jgi:hypothetical protein
MNANFDASSPKGTLRGGVEGVLKRLSSKAHAFDAGCCDIKSQHPEKVPRTHLTINKETNARACVQTTLIMKELP